MRMLLVCGCVTIATLGCTRSESDHEPEGTVQESVDRPADTLGLITDSNYSTPADALRAFYTAIESNDMETAKQVGVFLTVDYQEAFFKAMMAPPAAMQQFNRASVEAFGDSARQLPSSGEQLLAKIETIPVESTGEKTAVWKHQPGKQLALIKLENGWVIDFRSMEKEVPDAAVFDAMLDAAKLFSETAEKIESGELKTQADVREAFKKF